MKIYGELRKTKYGQTKHLGELESWLKQNSVVPFDNTVSFVVDYQIENNCSDAEFRFFISSKQLLEILINVEITHADATYNLVWQNYPVLILGTRDMWKSLIHLVSVFVIMRKRQI